MATNNHEIEIARNDQGQISGFSHIDLDRINHSAVFQALNLANESSTFCEIRPVGPNSRVDCYTVNRPFCDRLSKILHEALKKIKKCNEEVSHLLQDSSLSKSLEEQHKTNLAQSKKFHRGSQPYIDLDSRPPQNRIQEVIQTPSSPRLEWALSFCHELKEALPVNEDASAKSSSAPAERNGHR